MYKIESYTAVFFAVTTKYIYIYIHTVYHDDFLARAQQQRQEQ